MLRVLVLNIDGVTSIVFDTEEDSKVKDEDNDDIVGT